MKLIKWAHADRNVLLSVTFVSWYIYRLFAETDTTQGFSKLKLVLNKNNNIRDVE